MTITLHPQVRTSGDVRSLLIGAIVVLLLLGGAFQIGRTVSADDGAGTGPVGNSAPAVELSTTAVDTPGVVKWARSEGTFGLSPATVGG